MRSAEAFLMVLSLSVSSNSEASDRSLLALSRLSWPVLTVAATVQAMIMISASPIGTNARDPPITNSRTMNSSVKGRSKIADARLPANRSRPTSNWRKRDSWEAIGARSVSERGRLSTTANARADTAPSKRAAR